MVAFRGDRHGRVGRRRSRGQALVEFALVMPIFIVVMGGVIQYGILLWSQNTLTQIVNDAGRWSAAQASCSTGNDLAQAHSLASASTLIGYSGSFASENASYTDPVNCPPLNNAVSNYITIALTYQVPVFFPFIPGGGLISSTATFRVEPAPL
jgi:Flp pilus assembly protein TadG